MRLRLWLIGLLALGAWAAPPTAEQQLAAQLKSDLVRLAVERNYAHLETLDKTADWLESELRKAGYTVDRQVYMVGRTPFVNLETRTPAGQPCLVVGAHYDTVLGCPGANDNGSGVVATLALARLLQGQKTKHPIRFVLFANEEPPFFQRDSMGSLSYARFCKKRGDKIVAMLSLETLGYYSNEAGSQKFPDPEMAKRYGDRGNFVAFVSNQGSATLVQDLLARWKTRGSFPAQALVAPASVPGVGWSDHWSFWQEGYPAVMVTDTALYRYPFYHTTADTVDKVDCPSLGRVVQQLAAVLRGL